MTIDRKKIIYEEYMRSYYYKRKQFLNHLINCDEEFENVSLYKQLFKYFQSMKKHIEKLFWFFKKHKSSQNVN